MIWWDIQDEIIACIAEFICEKIEDCLNEGFHYYAVIGDEFTDRYAKKEILMLCLQYLQFINDDIVIRDIYRLCPFGAPTNRKNNWREHIKDLGKHGIDVTNCHAQAYNGASALSS